MINGSVLALCAPSKEYGGNSAVQIRSLRLQDGALQWSTALDVSLADYAVSNLVYGAEIGLVLVTTATGTLFGLSPSTGGVVVRVASWHTGAGVPLLMGASKNLLLAQNLTGTFPFGFSVVPSVRQDHDFGFVASS